MSLESGLVTRLNAVSAVTDIVSNRIFADVLPDDATKPAIVYQVLGLEPISNLNTDTGKLIARVQLTLIAATKLETISLSDACKTALQRFKGAADDITMLDVRLTDMGDQSHDLATDVVARVVDFTIYYED